MAGSASDDEERIGLEATRMGSKGAPIEERELAREFVRAKLQLGAPVAPSIGRYQLVRTLGRGGMGVVMAAHDPELDREVAIKVLHSSDAATSERAAGRLLREARSIARLSHPNVVQVYDTGVHEGRVYVVMEMVPGVSLRRWLGRPRDRIEVIDMMLAAGRGLMAAHQAGVIHRDFKPANVLVGKDRRPRVVDFGLARPLDGIAREEEEVPLDVDVTSLLMTATGAVMGTPAYMAPEQFVGAEASPRTDQFAFCVTVFEALLGRRPFAGNTFAELCDAVLHGGLRFPPEAESLPEGLRDALARGLRRRRFERFADMAALIDVVERAVQPLRTDVRRVVLRKSRSRVRERLPRLHTYLEGLPQGPDSHPECATRADVARLALTRHPIEDVELLPPEVAALVRSGLDDVEWIPEVHARIILTVIRDLHFPPGNEGNDPWARMLGRIHRAALSVGFFGFVVPSPGSSRLLPASLRAWGSLHRGTAIEIERVMERSAVLFMQHPEGLMGALGPPEVLSVLQTAIAFAGVTYTDGRVLEAEGRSLRFELHWA